MGRAPSGCGRAHFTPVGGAGPEPVWSKAQFLLGLLAGRLVPTAQVLRREHAGRRTALLGLSLPQLVGIFQFPA